MLWPIYIWFSGFIADVILFPHCCIWSNKKNVKSNWFCLYNMYIIVYIYLFIYIYIDIWYRYTYCHHSCSRNPVLDCFKNMAGALISKINPRMTQTGTALISPLHLADSIPMMSLSYSHFMIFSIIKVLKSHDLCHFLCHEPPWNIKYPITSPLAKSTRGCLAAAGEVGWRSVLMCNSWR